MFAKKTLGEKVQREVICYVQQPGLLAQAAREGRKGGASLPVAVSASLPVAIAEGKLVRDASVQALQSGICVGESVTRARRLCPLLLVVPLEAVDARPLSRRLYNALARLSPTVEPDGPDAGYLALLPGEEDLLCKRLARLFPGLPAPVFSIGPTKLAARARAESGVERLSDAPASSLLWPADPKVVGKLLRLGLSTFGEVAAIGEDALRYQLGPKVGTLLHRRAQGIDADPIRPLWPPKRISLRRDFALDPIEDRACLERELARLAGRVSHELLASGRFARRVALHLATERSSRSREALPPLPLQSEREIHRAALRLLSWIPPDAPVTGASLALSELELPAARYLSLFDATSAESLLRLERAKRLVAERYGPRSLTTLGKLPLARRDQRRALARESKVLP